MIRMMGNCYRKELDNSPNDFQNCRSRQYQMCWIADLCWYFFGNEREIERSPNVRKENWIKRQPNQPTKQHIQVHRKQGIFGVVRYIVFYFRISTIAKYYTINSKDTLGICFCNEIYTFLPLFLTHTLSRTYLNTSTHSHAHGWMHKMAIWIFQIHKTEHIHIWKFSMEIQTCW